MTLSHITLGKLMGAAAMAFMLITYVPAISLTIPNLIGQ